MKKAKQNNYVLCGSISIEFLTMQTHQPSQKADQQLPRMGYVDGLQSGRISLWRVIDVFIILIQVMILWAYTYVQTHHIVYFNYVLIIVCQLCLHKDVSAKNPSKLGLSAIAFDDLGNDYENLLYPVDAH